MNPFTASNEPGMVAARHAADVACQSAHLLTLLVDDLNAAVAALHTQQRALARLKDIAESRLARASNPDRRSHP